MDKGAIVFYSVKEIAEMLNVNEETVRRWLRDPNGLSGTKTSRKEGYMVAEIPLKDFLKKKPKYMKKYIKPRRNNVDKRTELIRECLHVYELLNNAETQFIDSLTYRLSQSDVSEEDLESLLNDLKTKVPSIFE